MDGGGRSERARGRKTQQLRRKEGERDGWMDEGEREGGRSEGGEALGRATQSRLQMWRQQQCGCFGPHQAALGVSPAHVPAPPVNQPEQASGSKL